MEKRHSNIDGLVDHATLRRDFDYWKFEEEVCKLQTISLEYMDDNTKSAFVINLYNLMIMIKFAFVKLGMPISGCLLF